MKTPGSNSNAVLLVCVLVLCSGIARAQGTTEAPAPSAPKITVYFATYGDEHSQISVDDIKQYGFSCTADDPAISEPLLSVLAQGTRPELTPAPPVNALFYIEREGLTASYTFGPSGIVWSGTHCYQLSRDDRRAVNDLVRHQIFTEAFWHDRVQMNKSLRINDLKTSIEFDVNTLNGKPIIVGFVVTENGKAIQLRLVQSCGNNELDRAAFDAVKDTKFAPVMENGKPKRAYFLHTFVVQ